MTDETLTPARLWKRMTADQRQRAGRAFWGDPEAKADHLQAVMLIAQHKKFRPKTVNGLDLDRKARHLATLPTLPDTLAARVLILYHLAEHRPMMGVFLDALGIAHENGLIQEDAVKPDPQKIGPAVDAITKQFAADDVRLYLETLLCQDRETWGALADADAIRGATPTESSGRQH